MPKKSLEILTESMFYVLMALNAGPKCGADAADYIRRKTEGRLCLGPATLYAILAKFEKEKYIQEVCAQGRKRTYQITGLGARAYREEIQRLSRCLADARSEGGFAE